MTAEDIKKIVGSGKLLRFKSGQFVIESGQITNEMFVVIDGEIKISLKDSDQLSFKIGPGQVFGEVSMLSRALRTADCVATQDTQLAIISRQNLQRLMRVEPELSTQLLFNLAGSLSLKLRRTNEYIAAQKKLAYWPSLLLEIRTHLNINQEDLADLLNIAKELIAQWENGVEIPSLQIQQLIEKIASDKNITSLGGMVEMVRNSPTRMFIVDDDYFVIATSQTSQWIENMTIEKQLTENARSHFDIIFQKLSDAGFWRGLGGQVIDYEFLNDNKIWRSVITSVVIRGRVYALVQQAVS
jgi:CRP/FNR family transcriptional regulator